jgi:hypothetical protein
MMFLAEGRYGSTRILATNTVATLMTDQTTLIALDVDSESRFGLGWDSVSSSQLNYAGRVAVKDGAPMTSFCNLTVLRHQQLGVAIMHNASDDLPDIIAPEVLKHSNRPSWKEPVCTGQRTMSRRFRRQRTGRRRN